MKYLPGLSLQNAAGFNGGVFSKFILSA